MGEAKASGLQSSPQNGETLMSLLFPGPQSQGPSGKAGQPPKWPSAETSFCSKGHEEEEIHGTPEVGSRPCCDLDFRVPPPVLTWTLSFLL